MGSSDHSDTISNSLDAEKVIGDVDTSVSSSNEEIHLAADSKNQFDNDPYAQGKIIVDWDGPDDPKNPQNWSNFRKILCTVIISFWTTSLYMGAAIYTPAIEEIMVEMNVPLVQAALGLTLFVWGYGLGSLWFSPMTEIPFFRGRNPTYFACQLIFACLQIPTALSNHIGGFAVLRFLSGIFASPPLSTSAASLSDMWQFPALGIAMIIWAFGAIAGPFLGPLIGGALQQGHGRRYIFWFMLAMSGGMLVVMALLLPETSAQELLIRKARRLRKETGDDRYIAPGEIIAHHETVGGILKQMFFKPIQLTIMEPAVLLMDLHLGLVYSVMYLFFESFPIVYGGIHGFNYVEQGLAYFSLLIGALISCFSYMFWLSINKHRLDKPEAVFGPTAVLGAALLPVGLLIFGWCSKVGVHWVVSMIGGLIVAVGTFYMFQSYFTFLSLMFPASTAGSAFASNNIVRSLMGGAFPLFGTVMYNHTAIDNYPVGWGCTIIAIACIIMIPLPVYLMLRGESLRSYAQRKYGDKLFR